MDRSMEMQMHVFKAHTLQLGAVFQREAASPSQATGVMYPMHNVLLLEE